MLAKIFSSSLHSVDAFRITIEVSVGRGIGYFLTGLPDDAKKESLGRVAVAIMDNRYRMPRTRMVVKLIPADIRKNGTAFDLPIALGILAATGQLPNPEKLDKYLIIGEMGDGWQPLPCKGGPGQGNSSYERGL
jgi:magnesium chelatase family protein